MRLAAKLLSKVEISAKASNQHEFNAGLLRSALGLPEGRTEGTLEITYLWERGGDSEEETCAYTLYDARVKKGRKEYRLYFDSKVLQTRPEIGDILIVIRPGEDTALRALVIPRASTLGTTIATLLAEKGVTLATRSQRVRAAIDAQALGHLLDGAPPEIGPPDVARVLETVDPAFMARALERGKPPATAEMAEEAQRVLGILWPGLFDPDLVLHWLLEVETVMFQYIERELGQRALNALNRNGEVRFDEFMTLFISHSQSRKSRRGQSLQHHFAFILKREGIPFAAQMKTEGKETPDFVIPGRAEYKDPSFPAARLRMVACKSVVKERWRQVLTEAERVEVKYLLTLDAGFTDDTLQAMSDAKLRPFVPAPILDEHYAARVGRKHLGTVTQLVDALKAAGGS